MDVSESGKRIMDYYSDDDDDDDDDSSIWDVFMKKKMKINAIFEDENCKSEDDDGYEADEDSSSKPVERRDKERRDCDNSDSSASIENTTNSAKLGSGDLKTIDQSDMDDKKLQDKGLSFDLNEEEGTDDSMDMENIISAKSARNHLKANDFSNIEGETLQEEVNQMSDEQTM